jgi:transcriptional regulator with XRE-family HTH domain
MIKNERQFKLTRTQLARFRATLDDLERQPQTDPLRRQLELDTVHSQIAELEHELAEYTGLRDGSIPVGAPSTIDDLPRLLIRQRIAAGMTHRDLADRLELKEQQVQRYEAEDWATANLRRLVDAAAAVGLDWQAPAVVPEVELDERAMYSALAAHGLDRDFVRRRIRPTYSSEPLADVVDLTARLNKIYGWTPSDVVRGDLEEPEPALAMAASFKLPQSLATGRTRAYTVYSHYLALLVLDATANLEPRPVPARAADLRARIFERHHTVDFESILETAWDLGIPVIPLADPGAFHAVLWRTRGRNVIVLKQTNRSRSRWSFDLLHELRHAAEEPSVETYAVVDDEVDVNDRAELVANRFAGNVLLDGRAEQLAETAVDATGGAVQNLKAVVPQIAEDNDVTTADLANYLAYRLSLQDINWWGTAQNLQGTGPDPFLVARRRLLAAADLQRLPPLDRNLLLQALEDFR